MQYGVELFPYQRVKKLKGEEKKHKFNDLTMLFSMSIYFLAAFLIGRVLMINLMAPFGVAFLIAVMSCEEGRIPLIAGCGTLLGYISLYNNVKDLPVYFIITGTLIVSNYILKNIDRKKKLLLAFSTVFAEILFYKLLIANVSIGIAFLNSF